MGRVRRRRADSPALVALALNGRAMAGAGPDDVDQRVDLAGRALEAARRADDPESVVVARLNRVLALSELGRMTDADAELELARSLAARTTRTPVDLADRGLGRHPGPATGTPRRGRGPLRPRSGRLGATHPRRARGLRHPAHRAPDPPGAGRSDPARRADERGRARRRSGLVGCGRWSPPTRASSTRPTGRSATPWPAPRPGGSGT
ncbi:MAG: hypothetical protein U5R31_02455 [Acidimicrobiia bacterium]|nr:hypothetical protein [Acidimicrobiia bacterium]